MAYKVMYESKSPNSEDMKQIDPLHVIYVLLLNYFILKAYTEDLRFNINETFDYTNVCIS